MCWELTSLTILSLPIHDYSISLDLLRSLWFLLAVFYWFLFSSLKCLLLGLFLNIQCYNKHIIFAKHFLLVCRYSVDFCMLTLYPVILLNFLIRFSSCVYFIWFCRQTSMLSVHKTHFNSSFPNCLPAFPFSFPHHLTDQNHQNNVD